MPCMSSACAILFLQRPVMPACMNSASVILFLLPLALGADDGFVSNGFNGSTGWAMGGSAAVLPNGILSLASTNSYAFYSSPFQMRNLSDGSIFSFSATFVSAMFPSSYYQSPDGFRSDGIAFVLAPNTTFNTVENYDGGRFGLLGPDNNGNPSNHLLCIELDTHYNEELDDIDDNHVGINVNSMKSLWSSPAGYYTDEPFPDYLHPLRLSSGKDMQVWIDYDHELTQLNVSLAPLLKPKPKHPLLAHNINLSQVFLDHMYVGFSASSSLVIQGNFILGCSFKVNAKAATFDYSKLPKVNASQLRGPVPPLPINHDVGPAAYAGLFGSAATFVLLVVIIPAIILAVRRCCRYREIREDWELEFGPHRFSYKDLFHATDGFKDKLLLGAGGFGKVYKGILPSTKMEVAVKVMSHDSKQGMKEFIAEVVSMGRLRHRNLVQLLGYCRRKGELLLVYEYVSNGSLDRHLYDLEKPSLDWVHRFAIIKGVASGLLYLHEEWEQVVIHRDVKAGNVLLDEDMNGRLGDFGLARLHDHGVEAHTTRVAGTRGYISPELARLGKATKATDLFAFGAFMLEVACGKRPIAVNSLGEPVVLVDRVLKLWQNDLIICIMDPRLGGAYVEEEAELVLELGLLCSHPSPVCRPSMRLIIQYLCGDVPFPRMPDVYLNIGSISELQVEGGFGEDDPLQCPSVQSSMTSLSGGR